MEMNRRFFVTLLVSFIAVFCSANDGGGDKSMSATKCWYVENCKDRHVRSLYCFDNLIASDTVINGITYHTLIDLENQDDLLVGYLREEDERVYIRYKDETNETVLYDFGLEVGDCIDVGQHGEVHEVTVVGVDSVYVGSSWRRRLELTDAALQQVHWPWPAYWVEGIGSDLGIVYPYGWGSPEQTDRMKWFGRYMPVTLLFFRSSDTLLSGSPQWSYNLAYAKDNEDRWTYADCSFCVSPKDDTFFKNNKKYQKLTIVWTESRSNAREESVIGVREDGGCVYVNRDEYLEALRTTGFGNPDYLPYEVNDDGELVLYDFNKTQGNGFLHVDGYDDIVIASVGIEQHGQKEFVLNNGAKYTAHDGCTSSSRMVFSYLNPPVQYNQCSIRLTSFARNGITEMFGYEDPMVIFTDKIQEVVKKPTVNQSPIYDLQGRRMQSDMVTKSQGNKVTRLQGNGLPKGIYIQNGRKFVVK